MKSKISVLSGIIAVLLMAFLFTSCDKDKDLFVGIYKGTISYTNKLEVVKSTKNGTVTVSKIGNTYSFFFSDAIPAITGVKFKKGDDDSYIAINDGLKGISITNEHLNILVVKDGQTWTANCKRK